MYNKSHQKDLHRSDPPFTPGSSCLSRTWGGLPAEMQGWELEVSNKMQLM